MFPLLVLATSALLLTLVLTPACRALCTRLGFVDHPDLRKLHRAPIPRAGGVAIFLGYAAALALFRFSPLWAAYSFPWAPLSDRIQLDPKDADAGFAVCGEHLAEIRPAATIVAVAGLYKPEMKIEIEVTAKRRSA